MANLLQFSIRRPRQWKSVIVGRNRSDLMVRLDIKARHAFAALMALTLKVLAAVDQDTVELRFRVDEFVDFGLEEPQISFEVDRMDPEGETLVQHHSGYRIVSNCDSPRRVVASLSAPIPVGTSLDLELDAPTSSAVSLGARRLGAGVVELLQGVGKVHRQGVRLTYTFRADVTASVGTVSPTITFSVVP
jgi:hypothetical protein